MYAGQASGKTRCALVCAITLFTCAFTFGLMSIAWIAVADGTLRMMGIIFLVATLVMIGTGIGLCCWMKRNKAGESVPQGPLVSGSAPPGSVTGHYIQQQPRSHHQGSYPTPVGAYPQPNVPYATSAAPYPQPTAPYIQGGYAQTPGFDPSALPSYEEAVK